MSLRPFAREAAIYSAGNIGLRMAALLLTPFYTYFLSLADFGLWATLQVTIQTLLILFTLGMRETFLRFTKEYEDHHRLRFLLGATVLIIVLNGLLVSVLTIMFLLPVFRSLLHVPNPLPLLLLTCAAALAQALTMHTMSFYRYANQAARFMSAGLAGAMLLFGLTVLTLYGLGLGVKGVLYAYITAYALLFIFVAIDVFSRTGIGFSLGDLPRLLRFGSPLVLSAIGQFAMAGASVYLLSYFAGLEAAGIYSLAYRFASILPIVVALPFQFAFQPLVFTNLDGAHIRGEIGRLFTYLLLTTTCASFFLLILTRIALPVIAPPAYASAFLLTVLLVPGQAYAGVHWFGETLLCAVRKTYVGAALNISGAIITVLLGLLLIPAWGYYGAAIATVSSLLLIDTAEAVIGAQQFQVAHLLESGRILIVAQVFISFLLISFLLSAVNPLVFCFVAGLLFLVTLVFLYFGPFCRPHEKALVRETGQRLRAILRARVV